MSELFISIWVMANLFTFSLQAQQAEPQISFAKESKPHSYYVKQAELWWKVIAQDSTDETAWYHYYRSCRNAQGTANWRSDFVDESPYLRLGEDIVALMERHIHGTFTYHFVKGSTGGVSPEEGAHLMKAYEMNPDFDGLLATVVTYATSTHNLKLRREANQRWYANNTLSPGLLTFGYNLLQSVPPKTVLLTQHDNDTYPPWMLQEAQDIRSDVLVINIDFLLYDGYRREVFAQLGIPPFKLDEVRVDDYEVNWANVVKHVLVHYEADRPLYISKTVDAKWYDGFEESLYGAGLVLAFSDEPLDLGHRHIELIEDVYLLDDLRINLTNDPIQARIDEMNLNYLESFAIAYAHYQQRGQSRAAIQIRQMALQVIQRQPDHPLAQLYTDRFD